MGLLSRFEKKVPSTAEDPAAINTAAHIGQDPEKHEIHHLDGDGENPNMAHYHVTPELEQRVLRKLDTRLVPLVMVLCRSSYLYFHVGEKSLTMGQISWRIWIDQILGTPISFPFQA